MGKDGQLCSLAVPSCFTSTNGSSLPPPSLSLPSAAALQLLHPPLVKMLQEPPDSLSGHCPSLGHLLNPVPHTLTHSHPHRRIATRSPSTSSSLVMSWSGSQNLMWEEPPGMNVGRMCVQPADVKLSYTLAQRHTHLTLTYVTKALKVTAQTEMYFAR